jgi:hypothetical protein
MWAARLDEMFAQEVWIFSFEEGCVTRPSSSSVKGMLSAGKATSYQGIRFVIAASNLSY